MGYRLTKIYTKKGDAGQTQLGNGQTVAKNNLRVECYGTIDELNSAIGLVLACDELTAAVRSDLTQIQQDLFDTGAELCLPDSQRINTDHTQRLENRLDEINEQLAPLKEFILPGGTPAAAHCHLARTLCRRAERRLVALVDLGETINPETFKYINRLSDFLFVAAREINKQANKPELFWENKR